MVNLGFISNSRHLPDHVRHVRILSGGHDFSTPSRADARIFADERGKTCWSLDWHVADPLDVGAWSPLLALQILNLAWTTWWLDVGSLQKTMNLPVNQALVLWGKPFWDVYQGDALVFLDVGGARRMVYQVVRQWEAQTRHVRFSTQHDLDAATS